MLPISDKFSHFQYATLEMFKAALNNYSMLKLRFLINTHNFPLYRNNVSHQCYTTNHDTAFVAELPQNRVELPQNRDRSMSHLFFYLLQLLLLRSLFPFKR